MKNISIIFSLLFFTSLTAVADLNDEVENRIPKINHEELAKKTEVKATCVTNVLLTQAGFGQVMVDESKISHPFANSSKLFTYSNKVNIQVLMKDNAGMICKGYTYVMTDLDGQLLPTYSDSKLNCYDSNGEVKHFRIDYSISELQNCK